MNRFLISQEVQLHERLSDNDSIMREQKLAYFGDISRAIQGCDIIYHSMQRKTHDFFYLDMYLYSLVCVCVVSISLYLRYGKGFCTVETFPCVRC